MVKKRVVVTGIGAITPLGHNVEETWKNIVAGKSGIGPITIFDASDFETKIAAEVKNFSVNDFFSPRLAKRMDKFAQFAYIAAMEAAESAQLNTKRPINSDKVAVIVGSGVGGIQTILDTQLVLEEKGSSRVSPFVITKILNDMAASQVSIMLGATGPNYSLISACATGTDCIGEGANLIKRGTADVVIAGAAEAAICDISVASFNACKALSRRNDDPQGASRPFDANRDGFVLGEGAGLLVLESLEHAQRRNVEPIVELIGYGASSDAIHVTHPDPQALGSIKAMQYALDEAELTNSDISYINAHGTATKINDKIETLAIKKVFKEQSYKIPISSTKSMIGHLLGAAGSVEAIFCIKAIKESLVPPTINLEEPDAECDLNYVPHTPIRGRVTTALSNSIGFGGHNATVIFKDFIS